MKTSLISIIALILTLALSPAAQAGAPWDEPHIEFLHTGAFQSNVPHVWQVSFTTGDLDLVLSPGQFLTGTPSMPSGCRVASPSSIACRGVSYDGGALPTIIVEAMYDGLVCSDAPISATASGGGLSATERSLVLPIPIQRCTFLPMVMR